MEKEETLEKQPTFEENQEKAERIMSNKEPVTLTAQEFFTKATQIIMDKFKDNVMLFLFAGNVVATLTEQIFTTPKETEEKKEA